MFATIQDVDKALTQVNSVFTLLNKHIAKLEQRIEELEAKPTSRRSTAKKEEENDA
jgi:BMFP domain-containing protein YqiC